MESRKSSRRVPAERRQRASLSCDFCRRRRCKCIRSATDQPCQACHRSGVACITTFHPKTRLYGSVNTIRDRMRCLEAIVQGVFPTASIETTPDLLELGRQVGLTMPDISTSVPVDTSSRGEQPDIPLATLSGSRELSNHSRVADALPNTSIPAADPLESQAPQYPYASRLVRDPDGRAHYVGPFATLSFFAALRDLMSRRQPASRFVSDNVAEALVTRNNHGGSPSLPNMCGAAADPAVEEMSRSVRNLRNLPGTVIEVLLKQYFEYVHGDFPLFNRAIFLEDYESFMHGDQGRGRERYPKPQDHEEPDDGWLVCLHLIIGFGSASSSNDKIRGLPDPQRLEASCWSIARSFLPRLMTKFTLSNVQALLLLALFYHNTNDRNAAWALVGCAGRIGISLGLHRSDVTQCFRLAERETRKRVWCTLYSFEQFLCLSLGRPSALDNAEIEIDALSGGPVDFGYGPAGCAKINMELQLLASRLRRMFPLKPRGSSSDASDNASPIELLAELEAWKKAVPSYLGLPLIDDDTMETPSPFKLQESSILYPPGHLRALVLLHAQYHNLVIMISRPFLLMLISRSWESSTAGPYPWFNLASDAAPKDTPLYRISRLARACVSSAARIAVLFLLLDAAKMFQGHSALDGFFAYSAAMSLLLRLLWVPPHGMPEGIVAEERKARTRIQELVHALRRILHAHPKCPTMQRLASVAESFAEAVNTNECVHQADGQISFQPVPDSNNPVGRPPSRLKDQGHNTTRSTDPYLIGNESYIPAPSVGQSVPGFEAGIQTTAANRSILGRNEAAYHGNGAAMVDMTTNIHLPAAIEQPSTTISPGLSQDMQLPDPLLWHDPISAASQHVLDWSNFEQFIGSLDIA